MQIQWYPGHMTKALRQMKEDIKLVDLVIEICDARIPVSSRNPEIDNLAAGKERIVVLAKADLADEAECKKWIEFFSSKGIYACSVDARNRNSVRKCQSVIDRASEKKRERDRKRGILPRPVRTMIVGIPNSGKSTFINAYAGKAAAKTGNKPGVTRGKQWIKTGKTLELLDTPGILWPKFEDETVGMHLAFVGAIKDEIFESSQLVVELIELLLSIDEEIFLRVYDIDAKSPVDIIEAYAKSHSCIKAQGELDYDKAGRMILNDFRSGRMGQITLEKVSESESDAGR